MKAYVDMDHNELLSLKASLEEKFKTEQAKGLSLNMASQEFHSWLFPCLC